MKANPRIHNPTGGTLRRLPLHLARLLPLLPLLRLGWGLLRHDFAILTANPVEKVIDTCGWWALLLLTLSLAMAPLQRLAGWPWPARLKRPLGLWAFAYGSLHLLAYTGLDQGFSPAELARDIAKRPFILVGLATWLALLPLALTSTRGWQRRLGRAWKRLHRLAYGAAGLATIHFAWKAKVGFRDPRVLLLAVPVAAVLLLRIPWPRRAAGRAE